MNGILPLKKALTAALLLAATQAGAESWRFALIGDTPYSDYEVGPAKFRFQPERPDFS